MQRTITEGKKKAVKRSFCNFCQSSAQHTIFIYVKTRIFSYHHVSILHKRLATKTTVSSKVSKAMICSFVCLCTQGLQPSWVADLNMALRQIHILCKSRMSLVSDFSKLVFKYSNSQAPNILSCLPVLLTCKSFFGFRTENENQQCCY